MAAILHSAKHREHGIIIPVVYGVHWRARYDKHQARSGALYDMPGSGTLYDIYVICSLGPAFVKRTL